MKYALGIYLRIHVTNIREREKLHYFLFLMQLTRNENNIESSLNKKSKIQTIIWCNNNNIECLLISNEREMRHHLTLRGIVTHHSYIIANECKIYRMNRMLSCSSYSHVPECAKPKMCMFHHICLTWHSSVFVPYIYFDLSHGSADISAWK